MTSTRYSDGESERTILEPLGVQVRQVDCPTEADIIENAQDAQGIIITLSPFGQKAVRELPNLKIIARAGIGLDNIDVSAALKNDIVVCNVPDYCISEVADHAMTMLLALERKLIRQHNIIRSGKYTGARDAKPINGLRDIENSIIPLLDIL
jgi:D-3-phosphoglycerate dehydrogenase / 2-oxoglutarate reductase